MSDLDALYRAILTHPDDDTPRLVYADALDDFGDPARAAFIRAHVAAARAAPWDAAAIRVNCFRGHAPPGADWLTGLPDLPAGLSWLMPPFRRGFPAAVRAKDAGAFVAAATLFEIAPVEALELGAVRAADLASLPASPALARIRALTIRDGLGQGTANAVLNSEHLAGLTDLTIGAGLTSARTAAAVTRSVAFRGLRAFSYRDEEPARAMVAALAGLANPPPLRALDLSRSHLDGAHLPRLLAAPVVGGLEGFDVSENHLGADGFHALAAGELPALRRLSAVQTNPGIVGVIALGAAEFLPQLAALGLGGNALGPEVAPVIGDMPLDALRVLDLRDNRFGDAGAKRLAAAAWLGGLLHLDLAENGIGAAGAAALADAPGLDGLLALDLGGNPLPAAAKAALRARFGPRLLA